MLCKDGYEKRLTYGWNGGMEEWRKEVKKEGEEEEEAGIVGYRNVLKQTQQGWRDGEQRGRGRGAQTEKGGD